MKKYHWMSRTRAVAVAGLTTACVGVGLVGQSVLPANGASTGKAFTTLDSGFTQELWGIVPSFAGGIAFAKDGDVLTNNCANANGTLFRLDVQTTLPAQNGTSTLHPVSSTPNVAVGCGMVNGKNRNVYTNTTSGVVEFDPATGTKIAGPFTFDGGNGNALGISADPISGDLVYVTDGTLIRVDAGLTTHSVFSDALKGKFIDGVFFDPTGNFLFAANRNQQAVAIIGRDGALVQQVSIGHEPDGIAFHAGGSKFVITNNVDGTMSKISFVGNDPSKPATVSLFASGGARGDLSQVGPDGALYLTQDGVRFDDGTQGSGDAIVRICCDFVAQPGTGATTTTSAPTTTAPNTTVAAEGTTNVSTLPATSTSAETLPFTGSSSGPLAGIGIALIAFGLLLGTSMRRVRLR